MKKSEKVLEPTQALILSVLMKSPKGISVGLMQMRLGVSLSDIAKAFRSLRALEYVDGDTETLRLTKVGRDWIMENQDQFAFSGEKVWRRVPEEFCQPPHPAHRPYAPITSKLSREKFGIAKKKHGG